MNKQKIQFIVMAVVLVICIGGYFGINVYYKNVEEKEETENVITILEIENYKDMVKVSYDCNGEEINLSKADNVWKNDEDASKKMDADAIETDLLEKLASINATQKIESPDDITQYGFSKDDSGNIIGETNNIVVTDSNGKTNKIYVGGTNPYDSSKYYIMVNDDKNVYVADSTINDAFSTTVDDLEEETTTVAETTEETTTAQETTTTK